jgi:aspartate/methionine/tyrosine aminotransferase
MKLSNRRHSIDASGIRKVFSLAAQLKNPCNLSIGLPDYDVPEPYKEAAIEAIRAGKNRYTMTNGIATLREKLKARYAARGQQIGDVIITSGTSGGIYLSFMALLDPGDGVMFSDPYFVIYRQVAKLLGAEACIFDTYPDFRVRREALEAAWKPNCKLLVVNSPANPTGRVYDREELQTLARFAEEKDMVLLSDEIYEDFVYDGTFDSPANYSDPERTIILSGMSKNVAMTGWRVGWATGPKDLVQALSDLQQYTYVCAPSMAQEAAVAALDYDMTDARNLFKRRRDLVANGLKELGFPVRTPEGAFYIFPEVPTGETGEQFVKRAIEKELLVVPGGVFSNKDRNFRISYAADTKVIERGLGILAEVLGLKH